MRVFHFQLTSKLFGNWWCPENTIPELVLESHMQSFTRSASMQQAQSRETRDANAKGVCVGKAVAARRMESAATVGALVLVTAVNEVYVNRIK